MEAPGALVPRGPSQGPGVLRACWDPPTSKGVGLVLEQGSHLVCSEVRNTLLSPSTGRVSLSALGEGYDRGSVFPNLLNIAFPIFVIHLDAVIPYLETLVLWKYVSAWIVVKIDFGG